MSKKLTDPDGQEWDIPEDWIVTESLDGIIVLDPDGNQRTVLEAHETANGRSTDLAENAVQVFNPNQVRAPAPVHTWLDSDPEALQHALELRKTNRANLMEWVRAALVEGTDFGRIHIMPRDKCDKGNRCDNQYHYSKPCLWKAGAEKICGMLGLRAEWPDLADAREQVMTPGCKYVILRCHLVNPDGNVVSEGIGGRGVDDDYGAINKVFKMAKKSSLIDAVLNACGLSEVFTQDIQDDDAAQLATDTTLDEDGVRYLLAAATELFGEKGQSVIASLARRRFHIDNGDPSNIPAYRLQDAIRSLEEKAAELAEQETDDGNGE